jgi:hypothetical protein
MSVEADLGALIVALNPYTKGAPGGMRILPFEPAGIGAAASAASGSPSSPPSGSAASSVGGAVPPQPDMSHIWLEVDSHYADSWTFKGQSQKINTAVRIAYRWPKTVGTMTIWVTDYLLVGFEGANGG